MEKQYNGRKRQIQNYFYQKVSNTTNVVALAGNNLDLHITDIQHIIGKNHKAYIYDINTSVINKFKYLENKQVKLINSDILLCNIERFIDLDLMKTLGAIEGIVYYVFNKQYRKFARNKNMTKHIHNTFMFTFSLRNNHRPLENFLVALLQDKKDINIISKEILTYRDGCPMCTVQIIYTYD